MSLGTMYRVCVCVRFMNSPLFSDTLKFKKYFLKLKNLLMEFFLWKIVQVDLFNGWEWKYEWHYLKIVKGERLRNLFSL